MFPRRKRKAILEMAEWVITYFAEPDHNLRKTQNPPSEEIFLINEWFFPNEGERRRNNIRAMHHISDVLCWSPDTSLVREENSVSKLEL